MLAHFGERSEVRILRNARGCCLYHASFLKLLQYFAMLILDLYQSLNLFPRVG